MNIKLKILTTVAFYLPGYKAGGPLRTIANMVDHLSDDFEFWIVTRDRDLGDTCPYANIEPNQWQQFGHAMVHYLSPGSCTLKGMANVISETPYDVLYLNSFFDPVFTIQPLLARKFGWLPNKPVIVAPRGEFSSGAIKLKYAKKCVYIQVAKVLKLYNNVIWQASSVHEKHDIVKVMKESSAAIHVALDLPRRACSYAPYDASTALTAEGADLRIVFLSRISPIKNLDYALRVLCKVRASVVFDIYGPTEDTNYWKTCEKLISQLPVNVSARYLGSVHPEQVAAIFSRYDLLFFPTLGENYGHVIAEALSVGTPVLLSDQTPWRDLHSHGMGWDLSLVDMEPFIQLIDKYSEMASNERSEWRQKIIRRASLHLSDPQVLYANQKLFKCAIQIKDSMLVRS